MAHHIETHGTQAAAVFARQDAWHQLGTTVAGDAFTAEEAMRLGHLGGWDVRTVALTAVKKLPGDVRLSANRARFVQPRRVGPARHGGDGRVGYQPSKVEQLLLGKTAMTTRPPPSPHPCTPMPA